MSDVSFIDGCLKGMYLVEEIDDFVHNWHVDKPKRTLAEFLGMSRAEYDLWVADDDILPLIIAAREKRKPIEEMLEDVSEYAMAARSSGRVDMSSVIKWLRQHGFADD